MSTPDAPSTRFRYEAQTYAGKRVSGAIDAADHAAAQQTLQSLGLRPVRVEPEEPPKLRKLSGDDFLAFNQQLAHLTAAGMPVERGLRLIARDMRGGRLRRTVNAVADDMAAGKSLAEAFDARRQQFPRLYGSLVDAGVKTGRLPGMLLNLGRHLELVRRLRRELWRNAAYPIVILLMLVLIVFGIGLFILPKFEAIFEDFDTELPLLTKLVLRAADVLPEALTTLAVCAAAAVALWRLALALPVIRLYAEQVNLSLPIIGAVLQRNLMARWCDALRLGVEAGVDLRGTVTLASDAIDSPALKRDGEKLAQTLDAGKPLSDATGLATVLPTVTTSIDLAAAQGSLAPMLASLSQMYRHEAELRLGTLNAVITPVALVAIGMTLGFVILALLLPLVKLITELT